MSVTDWLTNCLYMSISWIEIHGGVEALAVLRQYAFMLSGLQYKVALILSIGLYMFFFLRKFSRNREYDLKSTPTKRISQVNLMKFSDNFHSINARSPGRWKAMTLLSILFLILLFGSLNWGSCVYCGSSLYPDLLEASIDELVAGLESGTWSSVDLTKAYILRIQETNDILHAVTEINPDALAIAAALDAERLNGIFRSALHGIPILIKNNIGTKDAMNTTAGSLSLLAASVSRDAHVVSKLREAGVILLGKTNLSQWANYRSTNSSNGWSAHGGQVIGAYFPNMDPWGSSSGSGVGPSIGLAIGALGTETDGSIIRPSSANNLVGIKPSVGLTSRALVVPISEHQDTVGPMARSVKDAAYILSIIAGKDPRDNYTLAQPFESPPDYTRSLNFSSLKGARIGIPRNGFILDDTNGPLLDAFENSVNLIKRAGATVVDHTNFSAWDIYFADVNSPGVGDYSTVIGADFVSNLADYLSQLTHNPNDIHSLKDVANFTKMVSPEQYPDRNIGLWDKALSLEFNNSDIRFWEAYQHTSYWGGEGGVLGALKAHNLDALIMPSDFAHAIPALAGLPVVTVPMGYYPVNTAVVKTPRGLVKVGPNMPFGLSFLGSKWTEEKLIAFAFAYEQRTKIRVKIKPYITPYTQLVDVIGS